MAHLVLAGLFHGDNISSPFYAHHIAAGDARHTATSQHGQHPRGNHEKEQRT